MQVVKQLFGSLATVTSSNPVIAHNLEDFDVRLTVAYEAIGERKGLNFVRLGVFVEDDKIISGLLPTGSLFCSLLENTREVLATEQCQDQK